MKSRKILLLFILILVCSAGVYAAASSEEGIGITHKMTHLVLQLAVIILSSRIIGYLFNWSLIL